MFFNLISIAQGINVPPPPPPQPPPVGLPIDSDIAILFAAALIYGIYKVLQKNKSLKA